MTTLKKFNLSGKEVGHVPVSANIAKAEANSQMIKDYIVAIRANARQWSANTKTRAEVNHTTKKPFAQKGQGRARHGMLCTAQYRGGGRVFGPKPKFDQNIRINKKERRAVIRALLAEKIREHRICVIEDVDLKKPHTQTIAKFLKHNKLNGRILFLGQGTFFELTQDKFAIKMSLPSTQHDNLIKSLRNIPKVSFSLAMNISGYDVICAHDIVLTESALKELEEWLS